jgi:hypothetical protein
VVTARVVAGAEGVVTLLCGAWRVTHLPLVAIAVRPGVHVHAGARLGLLGASRAHAGLHLGVRRAGDRFGYVDPLRFLGDSTDPLPPPPITPARRPLDLGPAPRPAPVHAAPTPVAPGAPAQVAPGAPTAARLRSATHAAPLAAPVRAHGAAGLRAPAGARDRPASGVTALAPWPAWAGLALLLSGALAGGLELRRRRGRAVASGPAAEGLP